MFTKMCVYAHMSIFYSPFSRFIKTKILGFLSNFSFVVYHYSTNLTDPVNWCFWLPVQLVLLLSTVTDRALASDDGEAVNQQCLIHALKLICFPSRFFFYNLRNFDATGRCIP